MLNNEICLMLYIKCKSTVYMCLCRKFSIHYIEFIESKHGLKDENTELAKVFVHNTGTKTQFFSIKSVITTSYISQKVGHNMYYKTIP